MAAESSANSELKIGHVLFMDVVGYSKLLTNEQRELVRRLNDIVRATNEVRTAEQSGKIVRLPTGDGMVLAFFTSPDAPVRCALQISEALKNGPKLPLRMGIHSGPVDPVSDVNDRPNVAGAGINMAQRVMDCGDAGHILLSKRAADDLAQYGEWRPRLHELGEVEVKHGLRIGLTNFYFEAIGNPAVPEKLKRAARTRSRRKVLWMALALSLVLAASGGWLLFNRSRSKLAQIVPMLEKSVAVLPFENLSAEKENAFFADGVQNEILSHLAKIADLKVISRTSVLPYSPSNPRNLREIGQQLGVAHVLEGSVQRAGAKVRVSAQLIDARTDKHLWAGTYDRELADVFSIETELAQAIAGELQAKLTPSEKAIIEEKPTQDLVAYDLYVRAVSLIYNAQVPSQANLVDRSEAVELLNKAVARDPNFLLAYCQLAFLHDLIYQQEIDHSPARLALAKSAIDSAFRLRPDSGEARLALGWHLYWGYFDYDRARGEVALAKKSLPNNPRAYELAGLIDRREGRWSEATHNLERACELDPRNIPYLITLATTYVWLHDYDQMARPIDRIISLAPDRNKPRIIRAGIEANRRAETGPLHAAIETALASEPGSAEDPFVAGQRLELALSDRDFDTAGRLAGALPLKETLDAGFTEGSRDFWLAMVARLKGDVAAASAGFTRVRANLEETMRVDPDNVDLLSHVALIDAALGRKEEALREGRRAVELVPLAQEAMFGSYNNEGRIKTNFAMICAWIGEADLALEQLEAVTKTPGGPSYGELRLDPMWDPLRGDPRFEKIVASLAPKDVKR